MSRRELYVEYPSNPNYLRLVSVLVSSGCSSSTTVEELYTRERIEDQLIHTVTQEVDMSLPDKKRGKRFFVGTLVSLAGSVAEFMDKISGSSSSHGGDKVRDYDTDYDTDDNDAGHDDSVNVEQVADNNIADIPCNFANSTYYKRVNVTTNVANVNNNPATGSDARVYIPLDNVAGHQAFSTMKTKNVGSSKKSDKSTTFQSLRAPQIFPIILKTVDPSQWQEYKSLIERMMNIELKYLEATKTELPLSRGNYKLNSVESLEVNPQKGSGERDCTNPTSTVKLQRSKSTLIVHRNIDLESSEITNIKDMIPLLNVILEQIFHDQSCAVPSNFNDALDSLSSFHEQVGQSDKGDLVAALGGALVTGVCSCQIKDLETAAVDGRLSRTITTSMKFAMEMIDHIIELARMMKALMTSKDTQRTIELLGWATRDIHQNKTSEEEPNHTEKITPTTIMGTSMHTKVTTEAMNVVDITFSDTTVDTITSSSTSGTTSSASNLSNKTSSHRTTPEITTSDFSFTTMTISGVTSNDPTTGVTSKDNTTTAVREPSSAVKQPSATSETPSVTSTSGYLWEELYPTDGATPHLVDNTQEVMVETTYTMAATEVSMDEMMGKLENKTTAPTGPATIMAVSQTDVLTNVRGNDQATEMPKGGMITSEVSKDGNNSFGVSEAGNGTSEVSKEGTMTSEMPKDGNERPDVSKESATTSKTPDGITINVGVSDESAMATKASYGSVVVAEKLQDTTGATTYTDGSTVTTEIANDITATSGMDKSSTIPTTTSLNSTLAVSMTMEPSLFDGNTGTTKSSQGSSMATGVSESGFKVTEITESSIMVQDLLHGITVTTTNPDRKNTTDMPDYSTWASLTFNSNMQTTDSSQSNGVTSEISEKLVATESTTISLDIPDSSTFMIDMPAKGGVAIPDTLMDNSTIKIEINSSLTAADRTDETIKTSMQGNDSPLHNELTIDLGSMMAQLPTNYITPDSDSEMDSVIKTPAAVTELDSLTESIVTTIVATESNNLTDSIITTPTAETSVIYETESEAAAAETSVIYETESATTGSISTLKESEKVHGATTTEAMEKLKEITKITPSKPGLPLDIDSNEIAAMFLNFKK